MPALCDDCDRRRVLWHCFECAWAAARRQLLWSEAQSCSMHISAATTTASSAPSFCSIMPTSAARLSAQLADARSFAPGEDMPASVSSQSQTIFAPEQAVMHCLLFAWAVVSVGNRTTSTFERKLSLGQVQDHAAGR